MDRQTPTPGPEVDAAEPAVGGPSYPAEWAVFCDYAAATGQPALPTTVDTLAGFLAALPAAPATLARRIRAIAAAHRGAGHLLERPTRELAVAPDSVAPHWPRQIDGAVAAQRDAKVDPGRLLAACPTRGWPAGLWGRRDAFLIVLTAHLGYTHDAARATTTADVGFEAREGDEPIAVVCGRAVPSTEDARTCAACAVVRWLEVLGDLDGLGRGSARMTLSDAHAPAAQPHRHSLAEGARWRAAAQLLPAIDQHGWHDDYRPMTARAVRTRLALARSRGGAYENPDERDTVPAAVPSELVGASDSRHRARHLADVLGALDEVADEADALNSRIKALARPPVNGDAVARHGRRGRTRLSPGSHPEQPRSVRDRGLVRWRDAGPTGGR